jgi:translocator assembly and maintenance protein 41
MFVAGRMQKPVSLLGAADPRVATAASTNLRAALAAALLALPETFTTMQLHRQLCGLSYGGDIRMALGAEDTNKIARIAAGSRAALAQLYGDAVEEVGAGPVGLTKIDRPGTWGKEGQEEEEGGGGARIQASAQGGGV